MGVALLTGPVTVLLAAYNGEAFLPAQLASLQAQEDADFSVLMQDDGSRDGTAALLAQTAGRDPRFRLGACPGQHLGAIGNFWNLLGQTDAPYTALCDQDDVWRPRRLALGLAAMAAAEAELPPDTPVLVHGDCRLMAEDGSVLKESFFAHQGWDPGAVTLAPLLVQNNVTGCTVLMNAALRRLALEIGKPERMFMHDWFLALIAAAFGRVVFLPEALVDYRQHGQNVQGASRKGLLARGMKALGAVEKAKARIALTYRHTAAFAEAAGDRLPAEARRLTEAYLATEKMPKLQRIRTVRELGCVMQSPVTRAGQVLFG